MKARQDDQDYSTDSMPYNPDGWMKEGSEKGATHVVACWEIGEDGNDTWQVYYVMPGEDVNEIERTCLRGTPVVKVYTLLGELKVMGETL